MTYEEIWLPVSRNEAYEVSNQGRVRRGTRILRPNPSKDGYVTVALSRDGKERTVRIHILVCEAFHGPKPKIEYEVCHGNGIRNDNRADNLRWASRAENHADKKIHGTSANGTKHYGATLTEEQVMAARKLVAEGVPLVDVAKALRVPRGAIGDAARGRTWGHLPGAQPPPPKRKLTEDIVMEARRRARNGERFVDIARSFGVNASALTEAIRGRKWRHLPGAVTYPNESTIRRVWGLGELVVVEKRA